jgi:hypothetical protein
MLKKPLLCFALLGLISACGQPKRTEATLPPVDVQGFQSSGFSLYFKGPEGTTTALGQIFTPPKGHHLLIWVGFRCRGAAGGASRALDANVKLRISPWEGDHPNSTTLWESGIVQVKKDINGWVSFEVPHIKLNPNQRYIAWLSMSGLQNEDDVSFGVINMGPWTTTQRKPGEPWKPNMWTYDYPEGDRAFWRHSNPDGLIDSITESPWTTDGSGQNLHFKMVFENRKPSEK